MGWDGMGWGDGVGLGTVCTALGSIDIFTEPTDIYCLTSYDKCTYCKTLWIKASECKETSSLNAGC